MKKRNTHQIVICTLLSIILLFSSVFSAAYADGEKKSGLFFYRLKGNGNAVIVGYLWAGSGADDIYIPKSLDGYTVTEIGAGAFQGASTTQNFIYGLSSGKVEDRLEQAVIVLPDTITTIGEEAFSGLQVAAISIPNSVQVIEDKAFFGCYKLSAISIPASVRIIGSGAFANCSNLKEFTVDTTNPTFTTIDGVLYNKTQKELVCFPMAKNAKQIGKTAAYAVPDGIQKIGDYAFYGVDFGVISAGRQLLPDTVKEIGRSAFANTNCTNNTVFIMPNDLESIDDFAFANSEFGQYEFRDNLKKIGAYSYQKADIYTSKETRSFESNYHLTLPASIQEIGFGAFEGCSTTFETIDISQTKLDTISPYTFSDITVQNEIKLPSMLNIIADGGFSDSLINKIIIPSSVELIGNSAFLNGGSNSITFAKYPQLKTIGERAFYNHHFNSQTTFQVPESTEEIGGEAFDSTAALTTLRIPQSVTDIGDTVCNRATVTLEVENGSYAALYAAENGYRTSVYGNVEDTSWLNN